MKILLVTRGSQGDVFPYLTIATALVKRGHSVTLNVPRFFEKEVQAYGIPYTLQAFDDIQNVMKEKTDTTSYLKWIRNVIDSQFQQLIPLLQEHDLLVSTNSEFAAASVAEYCGKPFIRTAYAPLIPGNKIPPPLFPYPKPNRLFPPKLIWRLLNLGNNFLSQKTINRNREQLGMKPLKNAGFYATEYAYNFMLYSRFLGNVDPDWKYKWAIGGYCFNDTFAYDEAVLDEILRFIHKDQRPTIFFTFGSCSSSEGERLCNALLAACRKLNYKLVVGSGWAHTGEHLTMDDQLFLMKKPIPHALIFPHCQAVLHHGGSGTTHSVARAGVPQVVIPLMLDQPYFAYRAHLLGLGPEPIRVKKVTEAELTHKVKELIENPNYRTAAQQLAQQMQTEGGAASFCDFVEQMVISSNSK